MPSDVVLSDPHMAYIVSKMFAKSPFEWVEAGVAHDAVVQSQCGMSALSVDDGSFYVQSRRRMGFRAQNILVAKLWRANLKEGASIDEWNVVRRFTG